MKQVVVVRSDLQMSPGKVAAQVAHASMANIITNGELSADANEWLQHPTLIVCRVNTFEELSHVLSKAEVACLKASMWKDSVETETAGIIETNTCLAIGPAREELLDTVTGKLPLY